MTRPATSVGRLRSRRRAALKRDHYQCTWPAHPAVPPVGYTGALQVDHITELADGGKDELGNLQTLCDFCHDLKSRERQRRRAKEPNLGPPRAQQGVLASVGLTIVNDPRAAHPVLIPAQLTVTQALDGRGRPVGPLILEPGELRRGRIDLPEPPEPTDARAAPVKGARRHCTEAQFQAAVARQDQFDDQGGFFSA